MLRRFLVLFLLVCLLVLPAIPAHAQQTTDWPMHRGNPARTGELDGSGLQGDPVLLWQAHLPGPASRSPSVAQGLAFIGAGDGVMYAFDALTGEAGVDLHCG